MLIAFEQFWFLLCVKMPPTDAKTTRTDAKECGSGIKRMVLFYKLLVVAAVNPVQREHGRSAVAWHCAEASV